MRSETDQPAQVPVHPCQYSPEVIDALRRLIRRGENVYDPYAGTGVRLGALCDELGATYGGGDIEEWPGADDRVQVADATEADGYPREPFTVVTSPVYFNKRFADYANGPLPTTKVKGRRDYGISLGRALHPNNLARHTGRRSRAEAYWTLHSKAVALWSNRVLLNVDSPIAEGWEEILLSCGYEVKSIIPVYTQRYGGLDNAAKRADYEVIIEAERALGNHPQSPVFDGRCEVVQVEMSLPSEIFLPSDTSCTFIQRDA